MRSSKCLGLFLSAMILLLAVAGEVQVLPLNLFSRLLLLVTQLAQQTT